MILVFVTSVVIVTYATSISVLNTTMAGFGITPGASCATIKNCSAIPAHIGNNIYQFDYFLPFIFYMVMMAIIFSTVLLQPDPLGWLVGVFYLPIIYFVSAYISNIAHTIFTQSVIAAGVSHLPLSIQILANLPNITFLFALLYVIALAIRIWFYPQHGGSGGVLESGASQQASLR